MAWPADNEPARVPPKIQPMEDDRPGCGPVWLIILVGVVLLWAVVLWAVFHR